MSLSATVSHVQRDVCSRRGAAPFVEGAMRHEALSRYASAADLLADVRRDRQREYEKLEAIVAALLSELASSPSPVWNGLLLVLCKPMLVGLRSEIRGSALPSDDLDQVVVDSFFQIVARLASAPPAGGKTFARLRSQVRRRVLAIVAEAQREAVRVHPAPREILEGVEDDEPPSGESDPAASAAGADDVDAEFAQRAFLEDHLGGLVCTSTMAMLTHTLVGGGRLVDWVHQTYAELSSEDKARLYARDRRRHQRAVALLRRLTRPLRLARYARASETEPNKTRAHENQAAR